MIKFILGCRDYPGGSGWAQGDHKRERKAEETESGRELMTKAGFRVIQHEKKKSPPLLTVQVEKGSKLSTVDSF